jgi:tetratricopeptide (TPR) repeat protein
MDASPMTQARMLHLKGVQHYHASEYDQAVAALKAACQAYQEAGDQRSAAEVKNDLGVVYKQKREWAASIQILSEARSTFAGLGDRKHEAQALGNLGNLHEAKGEPEEAAKLYKEAAAIFQVADEHDLAFTTWKALSRLRMHQGRWLAALAAYETGLSALPRPSLSQRLVCWFLRIPLSLVH